MLREEKIKKFARDCVYFKGDSPCAPHLRSSFDCRCEVYAPRGQKTLLLQLTSAAAVIRSSALVHRLRQDQPDSYLMVLTAWPELVPAVADETIPCDAANILRLQMDHIDAAYNPDLSKPAAAVMNLIQAERKKGFYLRDGFCHPIDRHAYSRYLWEISPRSMQPHDRPALVQELFQVCGLEYRRELPRLDAPKPYQPWPDYEGPVVGLHTALPTGNASFWEPLRWAKLADIARELQILPVLLTGPQGDPFCRQIAAQASVEYPGPLDIADMLATVQRCDIVVTAAGMVFEMALALGKQAVLLHDARNPQPNTDAFAARCSLVASGPTAGLDEILPDKIADALAQRLTHLDRITRAHASHLAATDPLTLAQARAQAATAPRLPPQTLIY